MAVEPEVYTIVMDEKDLQNGMEVKVLRKLPDGRYLRVSKITVFPLAKGYAVDTVINPATQQARFMGWKETQKVFQQSCDAQLFCVEVSPLHGQGRSESADPGVPDRTPDVQLYEP